MQAQTATFWIATSLSLLAMTSGVAVAAINIPFTINLSETVTVTGTPRIAVDVGGNTRYATYTSGTGTNSLTFTLSPNIGDVDLDGVTLSSPIDLNGGTIKDTSGNDATLTFTPPNTTGIKINYPSLGMDFTNGSSGRYTLNGTAYNSLSSFLTASGGSFARNSIGTYFDSTGILQTASANTPRFDYDPVTHAAKGILIEESRTNLLKDSANPMTANWTKANVSATAGTSLAPDNTMSGSTITVTNTSAPAVLQKPALAAGYVFSAYIKADSSTSADVGLYNYTTLSWGAAASESAGLILQGPGTITQANGARWRITGLSPTQWTRFSVYRSTQADGALIYPRASSGAAIGDSVIMWGAQVEAGTFVTSYIPTTTTAVTRAVDSLSIPTGGWFFANEGTYFTQWHKTGGNNTRILGFDDPTNTPMAHNSANEFQVFGTSLNMTTSTALMNVTNKGASSYLAGTGSFLSGNGSTVISNSTTLPIPTILRVSPSQGTNYFNGSIEKVKYYPLRVSNSQLQLLTQ